MIDQPTGDQLINELLADPVDFDRRGTAYQLLQAYFHGLPVETLRPLLLHRNGLVRRAAMFVASELGHGARALIHDVVPLIRDLDPHIRWYAIESVMASSSSGADADQFGYVIQELENEDDSMRRLAMRLVSNANQTQIEVCSQRCGPIGSGALHEQGLLILLKGDSVDRNDVLRMLGAPDPLTRKYGAIAAKRLFNKCPQLLKDAALSTDHDVNRFSIEALKTYGTM